MSQNPELKGKESVSEPLANPLEPQNDETGLPLATPGGDAATNGEDSEIISQDGRAKEETITVTAEKLSELLRQAYRQGRNENIEARIETDSKTSAKRSAAGEILVKGLECAAKALLNPGRRSIWPTKR